MDKAEALGYAHGDIAAMHAVLEQLSRDGSPVAS